ncbi:MAG: transporter substrate-binding domain-containing protein, partial [Campylobacteraceae bacterium]|nr:transporter substrate-binding domain-containing protein [Campylobacteraceae bacterium]
SIKSQGIIKIGVRENFPPFSVKNDDEFEGFEVLLAKEIGKKILKKDDGVILVGVDAKDRIPMLKDGSVDLMIAMFAITEEREKEVDFSLPYLLSYMAILAPKDSNLTKFSDFRDKRLLVIPGTTSIEYVNNNQKLFDKVEVVECENQNSCVDMLNMQDANGYFHVMFSLAGIAAEDGRYEVTNKAVGDPSPTAAAVAKGNKGLLDAVNKAIIELSKEGFFKRAYEETFKIYFKDSIKKENFLVDDIYNIFG